MNLASTIEAVLFISGEPVSISKLARLTKRSGEDVKKALDDLVKALGGRGIILVMKDDSAALATSPEASEVAREIAGEEFDRDLTRAALETLAIIIYKGPVARSDVDFIRGVNSSYIVRTLMVRGLIERTSNPKNARAHLYQPSIELLSFLGTGSLEDIPQYKEARVKLNEYLDQNVKQAES